MAADSSSSSSSSDSSDSDEESEPEKKVDLDRQRATKKRRTDVEGSNVATATVKESSSTPAVASNNGQPGKRKAPGERFQRIKAEKVNDDFKFDNRYETKVCVLDLHDSPCTHSSICQAGPSNDYGLRAHQDLIVTRGAGFRKEKNKKKKGSYKGGEITVSIQYHSEQIVC